MGAFFRCIFAQHRHAAAFTAYLAAILFSSTPASAAGVTVGPFCLDGVKVQQKAAEQTVVVDGVWTPTLFVVDPGEAQPRITVFEKPIPASPSLETCAQTIERMKLAGINPIVSGRIEALQLRAQIFNGPGGNRVQIEPQALKATLASVESGDRPVAGGTIDFKGSKLWITSSSQILSQAGEIGGELEIEAWNRKIVGGLLRLPTTLAYRTDLAPVADGNLTVRVDLKSGAGMLWKGNLEGKPALVSPSDADFDALKLAAADLGAAYVTLQAKQGRMDVQLKSLVGTAESAAIPGEKFQWAYDSPTVSIGELRASGSTTSEGIELGKFDLRNVALDGPGTLASASGTELISGPSALRLAELRAARLAGMSSWTNAASSALDPMFKKGALDSINLVWEGPRAAPTIGGSIDASGVRTAGLDFASALKIAIPKQAVGSDWIIPILIDTPATSGSVTVSNGEQAAILTGQLDRFYLRGRIIIPLPDAAAARLEIAKGDLRAGIGAAVSLSPFAAGTKPNFLDAQIGIASRTNLVVATQSKGAVDVHAGALALGQPVFKVGENGTAQPASLELRSEGAVDFVYGLETRKLEIVKAKLAVRDVDFGLLGPSPAKIDINGDVITDPKITMASLDIEIDRFAPFSVGRASFRALQISAVQIERARDGDSGLGYSGNVSSPISIAAFDAEGVQIDDFITFGVGAVRDFKLGISNASIDAGQGIRFEKAAISLSAAQIVKGLGALESKAIIDKGALTVTGVFRVRTGDGSINGAVGSRLDFDFGGAEDAIDGNGRLQIGAFTGHANSKLVIKFDCEGTGQLDVPLEYNFAVGGADMPFALAKGKPSGSSSVGPVAVVLHSKGDSKCSNKSQKVVLAPATSGWTWGICTQAFPPKAWKCKWEWSTPEVSFSYRIQLAIRFVNLNAVLTNPRFEFREDGSQSICNVGAIAMTPGPIIGGYSPQIDSHFPAADRFVNAVLAAGFEAPQSLVATGIVSAAGWLVTVGGTTAGQCIGNQ